MTHQKKLKVVLPTIVYSGFTGVELYLYELSKALVAQGHDVTILCPVPEGELVERTRANGVSVYSFDTCPSSWAPDIIHGNEKLPTIYALMRWPDAPAVATIHSQFTVEEPFLSDRIYAYIGIRQEIIDHLIGNYNISEGRTRLIYNGFDFKRFRSASAKMSDRADTILFVGTIDSIRQKSIQHLIDYTATHHLKLRIVGKKYESYLDTQLPNHVEILAPRWDVESLFTPDVCATAGVLLGRSTIEGWIAERPGWIYDITTDGSVKSVALHQVPNDIDKFDINNVAIDITEVYKESIAHASHTLLSPHTFHDVYHVNSELVSRSISQGMIAHDLINRCDYLEGVLSQLSERVNVIERTQNSVSGQLHEIEKIIHTLRLDGVHKLYRSIKKKIPSRRNI